MSEHPCGGDLVGFLDAVAARQPTPGGGAVAAAAGALSCALARMVAAYSTGKSGEPDQSKQVGQLAKQLERADQLLRGLLGEDSRAYELLSAAEKRFKDDPSSKPERESALIVALTVPMEVAAAACESLELMERLLPLAGRSLISDLGVATVLAEATVQAASYMVYANAYTLDNPETRQKADHEIDRLVVRARDSRSRIEFQLRDRF